MKWEYGRQNTGYLKHLIYQSLWPIPWDVYILKYPENSNVIGHTDPVVKGKRYYRLNVILKKSVTGGIFWKSRKSIKQPMLIGANLYKGRINFFRPDIERHGVTVVCKGTRYVLSLGFLLDETVKSKTTSRG